MEAFTRRAVEEAGVLIAPASLFASAIGDVPADRFRVGFGRREIPGVLAALAAHLSSLG